MPFSALDPTVMVGVQAGWARGPLGVSLALDVAQPATDGRVDDTSYSLRARELRAAALLEVRWPTGDARPFAAAGPAVLLVESRETGVIGGARFGPAYERAAKAAAVFFAGVEADIGPGCFFGAAGVGLAGFDGTLTGDASAGSLELRAGYRFRL